MEMEAEREGIRMANQEEHAIKSESSNFSDEALRSYLLGRLGEAERSQLDQRLLTDDSLAERVQLAESQLIDQYASGELDQADQELFSRKFLTTEARQQNVRMSAALQDYARSEFGARRATQKAKPAWRDSIARFFSSRPTAAWTAAGSFALLILVLGVAWLASTRRPAEGPIATQRPLPSVSPQVTESPTSVVQAPTTPQPEVKPTPEPAPPVAVASVILMPGALRAAGDMARVAVPRDERDLVRLTLVLENPSPGTYQAELSTADGQTVTLRNNLKTNANRTRVTFDVPARLVPAGDYQIKLSRKTDGQLEPVGRYYFRALQE
jgi:anti-sigma factor RsiW